MGRGGARKHAQVSPTGGTGAQRTLPRRIRPRASGGCLFLLAQEKTPKEGPQRGLFTRRPLWKPLRTLLDGPASRLARVQATLALPKPASEAGLLKSAPAVGASCARPRNDQRSFPTSGFGEFPGGRPQVAPTKDRRNGRRSFPTSEIGAFPGGRPQVGPTPRKPHCAL